MHICYKVYQMLWQTYVPESNLILKNARKKLTGPGYGCFSLHLNLKYSKPVIFFPRTSLKRTKGDHEQCSDFPIFCSHMGLRPQILQVGTKPFHISTGTWHQRKTIQVHPFQSFKDSKICLMVTTLRHLKKSWWHKPASVCHECTNIVLTN